MASSTLATLLASKSGFQGYLSSSFLYFPKTTAKCDHHKLNSQALHLPCVQKRIDLASMGDGFRIPQE